MPKDLHPEIRAKVIVHLRRHLPPPTGQNERSSIRQGDLATVMRVNKLFNNLAAPRLYSVVVSDHLPSFLYNIDQPAATPEIRSKSQLLGDIKRLFLEYCDKSTPTYDTLMRYGGVFFHLVDLDGSRESEGVFSAERNWRVSGLEQLLAYRDARQPIVSMATCAFCDAQTVAWYNAEQKLNPPLNQWYMQYIVSKGARRVCCRGEFGPLAPPMYVLGDLRLSSTKTAKFAPLQWNIHLNNGAIGKAPAILGGYSRIYVEHWQEEIKDLTASQVMARTIRPVIQTRELNRKGFESKPEVGKVDLDLSCYIPPGALSLQDVSTSTSEVVSEKLAAGVARELENLGESAETGLDLDSGKDKWRFGFLNQAPACEACDWSFCDYDGYRPPR